MRFFVRIAYNENIVASSLWAGLLGKKGKDCRVENDSTNAVFFRRRRTAQRIRSPACGLYAHGVRTDRLAGPGCGRPHDPTAGFAFRNPLFVFEIVWNVLFTLARKTLKNVKVVVFLALNLHSASPENPHHQPTPRVCSYYLALFVRSILTTRRGVSCDGPADSAHIYIRKQYI